MKTLNSYTQEDTTKAFEKHGAFFAFSKVQFEEKRVEGVVYATNGTGMVVPKENYADLMAELEEIHEKGIKLDIEENGITAIIRRELANYECYYTGEIDDAVEALEDYGITYEQVLNVYRTTAA